MIRVTQGGHVQKQLWGASDWPDLETDQRLTFGPGGAGARGVMMSADAIESQGGGSLRAT